MHSSSKTTAGIWLINAPFLLVDSKNINELGNSIKKCLAMSRKGIPHPRSFDNLFSPILDLAGVKSYAAFAKVAKCVIVEVSDNETVTLTPTRNGGVEEGFSPLPSKILLAPRSDYSLGSAALEALKLSE